VEVGKPERKFTIHFHIAPTLPIIGAFPPVLHVGLMRRFIYRLHAMIGRRYIGAFD
jgi:hypothetical protein